MGEHMTDVNVVNLSDDVLPTETLRHGAYVCLTLDEEIGRELREAPVPDLMKKLGLENEYHANGHPANAVAFLSRISSTKRDIPDDGLLHANAVIHVASEDEEAVGAFCREIQRLMSGD